MDEHINNPKTLQMSSIVGTETEVSDIERNSSLKTI